MVTRGGHATWILPVDGIRVATAGTRFEPAASFTWAYLLPAITLPLSRGVLSEVIDVTVQPGLRVVLADDDVLLREGLASPC